MKDMNLDAIRQRLTQRIPGPLALDWTIHGEVVGAWERCRDDGLAVLKQLDQLLAALAPLRGSVRALVEEAAMPSRVVTEPPSIRRRCRFCDNAEETCHKPCRVAGDGLHSIVDAPPDKWIKVRPTLVYDLVAQQMLVDDVVHGTAATKDTKSAATTAPPVLHWSCPRHPEHGYQVVTQSEWPVLAPQCTVLADFGLGFPTPCPTILVSSVLGDDGKKAATP
jgi:hypothetical protein